MLVAALVFIWASGRALFDLGALPPSSGWSVLPAGLSRSEAWWLETTMALFGLALCLSIPTRFAQTVTSASTCSGPGLPSNPLGPALGQPAAALPVGWVLLVQGTRFAARSWRQLETSANFGTEYVFVIKTTVPLRVLLLITAAPTCAALRYGRGRAGARRAAHHPAVPRRGCRKPAQRFPGRLALVAQDCCCSPCWWGCHARPWLHQWAGVGRCQYMADLTPLSNDVGGFMLPLGGCWRLSRCSSSWLPAAACGVAKAPGGAERLLARRAGRPRRGGGAGRRCCGLDRCRRRVGRHADGYRPAVAARAGAGERRAGGIVPHPARWGRSFRLRSSCYCSPIRSEPSLPPLVSRQAISPLWPSPAVICFAGRCCPAS